MSGIRFSVGGLEFQFSGVGISGHVRDVRRSGTSVQHVQPMTSEVRGQHWGKKVFFFAKGLQSLIPASSSALLFGVTRPSPVAQPSPILSCKCEFLNVLAMSPYRKP